jgi:hypothetical protein
MKPFIHITWEYSPYVVGALSQELRRILPPLAKTIPLVLVVKGDVDGVSVIDGIKTYKVGQSVRTSPHVLIYSHVLNIDLVRGASIAIYDAGGASLLHTHDWLSSLAGVYLSSHFDIPLVISVYSTEITRAQAITSLLSMGIYDVERHCFQRAEALMVASEEMKHHLTKDYGVDAGKISVVKGISGDLLEFYRRLVR